MRRTIIQATLFLVAFAPLALAQSAAPSEGMPMIGRGMLGPGVEPLSYAKSTLVKVPLVQKELKITPEQLAKWKKAEDELKPSLDRLQKWHEYRIKPAAERDPQVEAALRQSWEEGAPESLARRYAIPAKVLDKKQDRRLDQIILQLQGPLAFNRREIQESLNLSEIQIAAILEIVEQGQEAMRKASIAPPDAFLPNRGEGLTPEQIRAHRENKAVKSMIASRSEAVLKVRLRVMQEITRQLVRKQRNTFQAMLGDPFDFNKRDDEPKPAPQAKKRETEESSP
jgi:hypothetical protein